MRLNDITQRLKTDNPILHEKWLRLVNTIHSYDSILVAFSGGVDSSLLAYVASLALDKQMIAVTVISGLESDEVIEEAAIFASLYNINYATISLNPFIDPAFRSNPPDRCYLCKSIILRELWSYAKNNQFQIVMEGQNSDDHADYRPGQRAVKETGTISPLADCGLSKTDIRALAQALNLSVWNKPSSPCLATRFPFGMEISPQRLQQVALAEHILHHKGFSIARVRYFEDLAVIEVDPVQIRNLVEISQEIIKHFESIGFKRICMDLKGYRMGSMNEGRMG